MSDIGSKQVRSVVVQQDPRKQLRIRILIVLATISLSLFCYWLGGQGLRADYNSLAADHKQAVAQLTQTKDLNQSLSQQLANLQTGADIDKKAVNDVRALVSEHKATINELSEEISFYKGLMAPTERERGLSIRSWEVYPGSTDSSFQFKLVMQQLALKHTVLKGGVTVVIDGNRNGVAESFSLDTLSNQIEGKSFKLRFKYFQYVEGEIQLPAGFVPESVNIVAKATAPKSVTVEKNYSWLVQAG